jgi:outer membrane lipoprotein-sorting protein
VWNYDKTRKKVVISSFFDEPTSFSIERFIFDYPEQCRIVFNKIKSDAAELSILLIPKDEQLDVKEIRIWVDKNYMLTKLELVDLLDTKYGFQFSNIVENVEIQDAKFKFYPPKGTQIIDLR